MALKLRCESSGRYRVVAWFVLSSSRRTLTETGCMIVNWEDVDSTAILAIAYDAEGDAIHVRFHSGAEWRYLACSRAEWAEFHDPLTSKGRYVNDVLKRKPAERLA
jgi:hypothetical protein